MKEDNIQIVKSLNKCSDFELDRLLSRLLEMLVKAQESVIKARIRTVLDALNIELQMRSLLAHFAHPVLGDGQRPMTRTLRSKPL